MGLVNSTVMTIRFRDRFYLTFRSCPDGHMVHPTASVIIMTSADGKEWEQVHRFSVPERDTRDPHFLVFKDKLFVYTGTWFSGKTTIPVKDYDLNKHLGFAAWSEDGSTWNSPILLDGTFGHYIWRAAAHDGHLERIRAQAHKMRGYFANISAKVLEQLASSQLRRRRFAPASLLNTSWTQLFTSA